MPARPSAHVDPRSPFAVDTRELGRRPGSMVELDREVDAPAGWGLELVSVPAGTTVELDLRLESVVDGVLVTAQVRAPIAAECGRCLEPVEDTLEVTLAELFTYEPDPDDDEVPVLDGDIIDLEPVLRDAIVLALPVNPVCDEACEGLCATCGERYADLEPGHAHDQVDPRWAKLSGLDAGALVVDDTRSGPDVAGRPAALPEQGIGPAGHSSATMDDAVGKDPAASRLRES